MNKWLSIDIQLGRAELVDPNHNSQLALDDTVVDALCWSFDVVFDPAEDVLRGSIAKEDDCLFVTLSGLAERIHHTV